MYNTGTNRVYEDDAPGQSRGPCLLLFRLPHRTVSEHMLSPLLARGSAKTLPARAPILYFFSVLFSANYFNYMCY